MLQAAGYICNHKEIAAHGSFSVEQGWGGSGGVGGVDGGGGLQAESMTCAMSIKVCKRD